MQDLFGGTSENQQGTSQSGFALLPPEIQNAFKSLATGATNTLLPSGTPNASLNTLPALNPASKTALSQIQNQNFAITPESIQRNIAAQTDPYQQSVINQIERAQNGNESQLNSYLTNSGTFGGNRGMLGSSDIAQSAADQIGGFLSNEYNNNLNNALTVIPQNQASSASAAVNGGLLGQQQAMQNKQAPITALQQLAQLMGVLPQTGGSTEQQTKQSTSNNSLLSSAGGSQVGNLIGSLGSLATLF